ncbi:hypothetical protein IW261DRAFT_1608063 [Armillaria novae-zelandiae]|uniref:Uncharacterized protein n=1 Tax=Armillaria novae-zelandiae TaxID=153914 RepID=A0AA39P7M9_9AGAR|nr:hypothetical protein IW261DRAFT_1608063 [Armillaria novae-zelandiae]
MSKKQLHVICATIFYYISPVLNAPLPSDDNDGSSSATENPRSLWSIPWSCLVTIVACTWLPVHPNVPGRKLTESGRGAVVVDRVKTMAIAVLAPEVIVAWAASQFIVAWRVFCLDKEAISIWTHTKQKIKDCCCCSSKDTNQDTQQDPHHTPPQPKLTMTHGFFLSMGGFYEEGTEDIITLERLKEDEGLMKELAKTGEPIRDKSKADAFSKILSILQIAWFITQCMARANQHLTVTLLEVTALAFAVSSIIASLLWFYKPLNVRYPIGVTVPTSSLSPQHPIPPSPEKILSPFIVSLMKKYSILFGAGRRGTTKKVVGDGVPRFWAGGPDTDVSKIRAPTMLAVGVLFGAIHCAAWSSPFPSHTEMMLWRFSSVAVLIGLVGPLLLFIHGFRKAVIWIHTGACDYIKSTKDNHILCLPVSLVILIICLPVVSFIVILMLFLTMMLLFGLILYTAGRLILLVLAFVELRSLPPSSLDTVQWTTYMPHI